jgi:hypothetical protein
LYSHNKFDSWLSYFKNIWKNTMDVLISVCPWTNRIVELEKEGDDATLENLAVKLGNELPPVNLLPSQIKELKERKPGHLTWDAFLGNKIPGIEITDFLIDCAKENEKRNATKLVEVDPPFRSERRRNTNGIVVDIKPRRRLPRLPFLKPPRCPDGLKTAFQGLAAAAAFAFIMPVAIETSITGLPKIKIGSPFSIAAMASFAGPITNKTEEPTTGFRASVHSCSAKPAMPCLQWLRSLRIGN